jgi:hypothetical protein
MTDITCGSDSSRISLAQVYEVEYWSDDYGVAAERLKPAMQAAASSPQAVGHGHVGMARPPVL